MLNTQSLVRHCLAASLMLASFMAPPASLATTKSYSAPADTVQLKASALPGFAKASVCYACHSAEYIAYQPPTAARPYWNAMVNRMKKVFNAPVQEEDIPEIVDYLVKTYGNEQPNEQPK
ncbi:MAG: cytochrome c [Burkholderiaceae bacterium]|nr:cytochrome c [Burkholderiaceae bacterium]